MKKKKCIRKVRSGGIIYTDEEGRLYRPDGPAIIYNNGREVWSTRATPRNTKYYLSSPITYIPAEPHRKDGPAVIEADGTEVYKDDRKFGKFHVVDFVKRMYADINPK